MAAPGTSFSIDCPECRSKIEVTLSDLTVPGSITSCKWCGLQIRVGDSTSAPNSAGAINSAVDRAVARVKISGAKPYKSLHLPKK